jgi:hypothetical protein
MLAAIGVLPTAADELLRGSHGPYRGRVIEAGSGQPIAGAGVFMTWAVADESGAPTPFEYREAQTNEQGDFVIDAAAIEQTPRQRALQPRVWVYKAGHRLYPESDVEPRGAPAAALTKGGAVIRLIGARADAERTEIFNDFVTAINRYAAPQTSAPILVSVIEAEFNRLKTVKPDQPPPVARPAPQPRVATRGVCEVDPAGPPPLAPPKPPSVPKPGQYNPFEGRRAPYYGRVVDAQTGAPRAGAVVVAVWSRRVVSPFHATSVFHDACEVLTDAAGHFILDGRAIENAGTPRLEPPEFRIFYPGYGVFGAVGHRAPAYPSIDGDVTAFHAVTVRLVKLETREQRLDALSVLPYGGDVPRQRTPHLARLLDEEHRTLFPGRP